MIEALVMMGGVGVAAVVWLAWEVRARRVAAPPRPKRARVPKLRGAGDGRSGRR